MPGVAPLAAVPHQTNLQHPQDMVQVGWEWDGDWLLAFGPGEQEGIVLATDSARLPDRRAPPLAFVRVARTKPTVCPGGLARLIEPFLGGVFGVRVQEGRIVTGEIIVQSHPSKLRQPVARAMAALAIHPVVGDERARVDCATGPIERVGSGLGQFTWNDVSTDH